MASQKIQELRRGWVKRLQGDLALKTAHAKPDVIIGGM